MWPLRIERFIEAVVARLQAIQEALREQVASGGHTREADQEASNEIRWDRIGRRVTERQIKKRSDREAKADAEKKFEKTHRQQVILNLLTLLAVIGAIAYATVAVKQWREMIRTSEAAEASAITADKSLNENAWQFRKSLREIEAQTKAAQSSAKAAQDAAEVARETFISSLGANVSIGRKDGTVAEFITSKDHPEKRAQLVVYFQNTGHFPATVYWDTPDSENDTAILQESLGLTVSTTEKGDVPLPPSMIDKHGEITEGFGETIAGDSVRREELWDITTPNLEALPGKHTGFYIHGYYAYCDQLGTWSTHMFTLNYRYDVPTELSFSLMSDVTVPNPILPKMKDGIRYFPPCTSRKVLEHVSEEIKRKNGKK